MLDDAAIERWSRQILLEEVGGRGQERLCRTTVEIAGDGVAADFAATLVAAAGCAVVRVPHAEAPVIATVGAATVIGGLHRVDTLTGRPCAACTPERPEPRHPSDPAQAQAVGALVAAEALRAALGLAVEGRRHVLDPERGVFASRAVAATGGCTACASDS